MLLQSVIISVSEEDVVWEACCLGIVISQRTNDYHRAFLDACGDFRYAWMFCGSVHRFRYAVRMKHSTFRSAMAVSHYFCFWTACCQGIKDTLAKFENAVLVDVIIADEHIDILVAYSLRTKHFCAARPPCVHRSFYLSLTTWLFHMSGRLFNWRVDTTWSDRHDPSKYLQLPRTVRLPAVKLTTFLNFTTRHSVSRVVNSNCGPTQFMYIGHVWIRANFSQILPGCVTDNRCNVV